MPIALRVPEIPSLKDRTTAPKRPPPETLISCTKGSYRQVEEGRWVTFLPRRTNHPRNDKRWQFDQRFLQRLPEEAREVAPTALLLRPSEHTL